MKMRPWSREKADIDLLVASFFQNDPYYPRPRASDTLWETFREGYAGAYPEVQRVLAYAVLQALEEHQARCDANN